MQVDLASYTNSEYHAGANLLKRSLWYLCNAVVIDSWWMPLSAVKRTLLRLFGASIGKGVVIKPRVNIKYPWRLTVGDHSWIGEGVWIDNLADVKIGKNACISQGARLLTGNHDYKDVRFGLITKPICIEDGAWVGAFAVVAPGVTIRRLSVLSMSGVAVSDTEDGWIYRGNPAQKIRLRIPTKTVTSEVSAKVAA